MSRGHKQLPKGHGQWCRLLHSKCAMKAPQTPHIPSSTFGLRDSKQNSLLLHRGDNRGKGLSSGPLGMLSAPQSPHIWQHLSLKQMPFANSTATLVGRSAKGLHCRAPQTKQPLRGPSGPEGAEAAPSWTGCCSPSSHTPCHLPRAGSVQLVRRPDIGQQGSGWQHKEVSRTKKPVGLPL